MFIKLPISINETPLSLSLMMVCCLGFSLRFAFSGISDLMLDLRFFDER